MLVAARRSLSLAAARTRAASTYNTEKTTFLLNWYANPYHTPIYVAKEQGWLKEEGIDLAILEATDPSDVTEIVGDGAVGLGLKAMIHILAAKDKGIDLKSFGTLLDEPPTGLIHKKSANINKFSDIQGKKVCKHVYTHQHSCTHNCLIRPRSPPKFPLPPAPPLVSPPH